MPDLTPNLNLKKPNWDTEAADIRVFNDNMDIIDEKITDGNKTIQDLEEKKQNKEDSTLKTIAKTIVGAINELFTTKLDKGGYTGNAKNLNDEISKKASKTVLGRMIVGDNLTVDDNGRVSATKTVIVNDLTTGGADKAGSAEMVKKLGEDKQDKTDSSLTTTNKDVVKAINEIDFTAVKGSSDLINSLSEYKRDTFASTLSALKSAGKLPKLVYIVPRDFSDLSNFKDQDSKYEITILYAHIYGIKCIAHNSGFSDIRFIGCWNLGSDIRIISAKLDGYAVGRSNDIPLLNENVIKYAGNIYLDSTTNRPYYCYLQAPATVTTPNGNYFIPASNLELAKGKTIITLNDNSVVEKYDNGLMIQYGTWGTSSGDIVKFPVPFVRGFPVYDGEKELPMICGATTYGSNTTNATSAKVYTINTNLTQVSFVVSQKASISYTAVGYWK